MQPQDVSTVRLEPPYSSKPDFSFRLLDPSHFLLPYLGAKFPLDAAIGLNGRVWINSKEPAHIIAIARCIENVDPDGGAIEEIAFKRFFATLEV
jgi:exosome complex component RRP40